LNVNIGDSLFFIPKQMVFPITFGEARSHDVIQYGQAGPYWKKHMGIQRRIKWSPLMGINSVSLFQVITRSTINQSMIQQILVREVNVMRTNTANMVRIGKKHMDLQSRIKSSWLKVCNA